MKFSMALLMASLVAGPARGHFVYLVPDSSGQEIQVVFSETPHPDEKVSAEKIAGTQLFAVDAGGNKTRLKAEKLEHHLTAKLPGTQTVLLTGVTEYGVANSKHTGNIPVHIQYFSKAVVGNLAQASHMRLDKSVPLEIVPVVREGKLEFLAFSSGKPVAEADCTVKTPGDEKGERSKTTASGQVPGRFDKPGRYGVWVRTVDLSPGSLEGARFDKTHVYATLVVDFPGPTSR